MAAPRASRVQYRYLEVATGFPIPRSLDTGDNRGNIQVLFTPDSTINGASIRVLAAGTDWNTSGEGDNLVVNILSAANLAFDSGTLTIIVSALAGLPVGTYPLVAAGVENDIQRILDHNARRDDFLNRTPRFSAGFLNSAVEGIEFDNPVADLLLAWSNDARRIISVARPADGATGRTGGIGLTGGRGATGERGGTGLTGGIGLTGLTGGVGLTGAGFRRIYLTLPITAARPDLPLTYIGTGITLTAVNGSLTWRTAITDALSTEQVWFIDLTESNDPNPFHTPNGRAELWRGNQGFTGDRASFVFVVLANDADAPTIPNTFTNNSGLITGTAGGQPPSWSSVAPTYDEDTQTLWHVSISIDGQTGHISTRQAQPSRVNGKRGRQGDEGAVSTTPGPRGDSLHRLYLSSLIASGTPDPITSYTYNAEAQTLAGFSASANWGETFPQGSSLRQVWFVDIVIPGTLTTGTYAFTIQGILLQGGKGDKGDPGDGLFGSPKEEKRSYQANEANPQSGTAYAIQQGVLEDTGIAWIRIGLPSGDEAVAKNLVDSTHTLWVSRTTPLENRFPIQIENADGGGRRYFNSSVGESDEIWEMEFRVQSSELPAWLATPGDTNFFFVGEINPTADTALEIAELALLQSGTGLRFIRRPRQYTPAQMSQRLRPSQNGNERSLYWIDSTSFYLLPEDDEFELMQRLGADAFDNAVFGARDIGQQNANLEAPTRRFEIGIRDVQFVSASERASEGNWILFTTSTPIPLNLSALSNTRWVVLNFEFEDERMRQVQAGNGAFFGRLVNGGTPSATNRIATIVDSASQKFFIWGVDATSAAILTALDFQAGDDFQIVGLDANYQHIRGAFIRHSCGGLAVGNGVATITCPIDDTLSNPVALATAHFVSISLSPGSALLRRTNIITQALTHNALQFFGENLAITPTATSESVWVGQTKILWSTPPRLQAAMMASGFEGEDLLLISTYDVNRKLLDSEFIESDEGSIEIEPNGGSVSFTRRSGNNPSGLVNAAWVDIRLIPGFVRQQVAYAYSQSDPLHIAGKNRDSTPSTTLPGIHIANSTLIQFSASSAKQGAITANGIAAGARVEITAQDATGREDAIELRDITAIEHEAGYTAIRFDASAAALPAPFAAAEVLSIFLRAPVASGAGDYVAALAARSNPLQIVGDRISVNPTASNPGIAIGGAGASILWYSTATQRAYITATGFKAGDRALIEGWNLAGERTGSIIKFAESPIDQNGGAYQRLNFTAQGGVPPAGITAAARITILLLPSPPALDTTRYDAAYTRSQADNYTITGARLTSGAPSGTNQGIQLPASRRIILFYVNPNQRASILASDFQSGNRFELGIVNGDGTITSLHLGLSSGLTSNPNYLQLNILSGNAEIPGAFFQSSVNKLSLRIIPELITPTEKLALITATNLGDTIALSMASANSPTRFTGRRVAHVSVIDSINDSINVNSTGSAIRFSASNLYKNAILASGFAVGDYALVSQITNNGFLYNTQRIKITSIAATNFSYIQFNTAANAALVPAASATFLSLELLPGTNLDWTLQRQWGGTGGEAYIGSHGSAGVEIGYDAEAVRWNIFELENSTGIFRSRGTSWIPETGSVKRFLFVDRDSRNLQMRPNVGTSPLTKNRVSFSGEASAAQIFRLFSRN